MGRLVRRPRPVRATMLALVLAPVLAAACTNVVDQSQPATTSPALGTSTLPSTTARRTGVTVSPNAPYNAQDFLFTERWITHSNQLVGPATVARDSATSQEVRDFAEQVRERAAADADALTALRQTWTRPVSTEPSFGPRETIETGERLITPDADIPDLSKVPPGELDNRFLEFLLEHNRNGLIPLDDEKRDGKALEARDLATKTTTALLAENRRAVELQRQR
ncbi:MAG: DUF305 domain-containing protein [Actinobacteria bacterium]|nr:DUF305 domain-containing protein [Actinomycetota bacterium]